MGVRVGGRGWVGCQGKGPLGVKFGIFDEFGLNFGGSLMFWDLDF